MKNVSLFLLILFIIAACQKPVITLPPVISSPTDTLTRTDTLPPAVGADSIACTPFAQSIRLQIDQTHFDSAFLQLPCSYKRENKLEKYPLLIFLNGVFEGSHYGTLQKMKKLGPSKFMLDSLRYSFMVNGKMENMIVVCPQSDNGYRLAASTNKIIDSMIARYNVDTNRIYLTGLSAGANSVLRYLTEKPEFAARIAAAVPMSTTFLDSTHRSHFNYITNAGVPLYWYCGKQDKRYLGANEAYVKTLNQLSPGLVTFALYNGEHRGWNPMYDPTHKRYNPNMYEWLLQHKK